MKKILKKYRLNLTVAPLLKVLEAIFELFIPLLLAQIINDFTFLQMNSTFILSLYLIGFLASFLSQYLASATACKIEDELRTKAIDKILKIENPEKEITNIITSDISQIKTGINLFIRLGLRSPVLMIGSVVMAFLIEPMIATLFVLAVILITAILIFVTLKLKRYNTNILQMQDSLFSKITRVFEGLKVIKTFNKEKEELYEIEKVTTEITDEHIKLERINTLATPLTYFTIQIIAITLLFIISKVFNNTNILKGDVVALINYLNQMLLSLIIVINLTITYTRTLASKNRITKLLERPEKQCGGDKYLESLGRIQLQNVSFKNVLNDINITINRGETIAVIGPTGSGKSVLLELLNNSLQQTSGKIVYDGFENISDKYIHDNVSTVYQKPKLFNDTIKNNIILDKKIDDIKIIETLKNLKINKNLNEIVEENGKNMSGGEKQRIALARALIKNSHLLLIDDAASSLDKKTEKTIIDAIKKLPGIKVIVSSRISSIIECDKILFLVDGKQICFGNHETNLENNEYRKFIGSEK